MATLALEIHDAGLLALGEDGDARSESPGYALFEGGALLTGEAALGRAREKPRLVHRRFWQDLDTAPLGRPFPRDLSAADLAHAHLSEVWSAASEGVDSVLLAIPGCFSERQLGLTLGIARACGMPVAGMVDLAVAAAAGGYPGTRLLHLDLHLYRTVATELAASAPLHAAPGTPHRRVVRRRTKIDEEFGLADLQDAWARRIAELFVLATRFDPLHSAATEQALYDRLPRWLARLRREEVLELDLGPAGRGPSIELTRPDVVAAADAFYDRLLELVLALLPGGESVTLLLSHRLAELPGLESRLAALRGVTTAALPRGAAATGALACRREIRAAGEESGGQETAGALPFVSRLSYRVPRNRAPAVSEAAPAPELPPTHLVHEGFAYPIPPGSFLLGTAIGGAPGLQIAGHGAGVSPVHCRLTLRAGRLTVEDSSTHGTFLGGERLDGPTAARPGDRLRLGTPGIEVLFVRMVETPRSHPPG